MISDLQTFLDDRISLHQHYTADERRERRRQGYSHEYARFNTANPHSEIVDAIDSAGFYDGQRSEFQIRIWRDRAVYVADADNQAKGIGCREYGTDLQIVIERLFAWIDAN